MRDTNLAKQQMKRVWLLIKKIEDVIESFWCEKMGDKPNSSPFSTSHFMTVRHCNYDCHRQQQRGLRKKKMTPPFDDDVFTMFQFMHTDTTSRLLFKNRDYSKCRFLILAFFANFCPIKTDLSGNTVWPQALGFQKLAKMDNFWHF